MNEEIKEIKLTVVASFHMFCCYLYTEISYKQDTVKGGGRFGMGGTTRGLGDESPPSGPGAEPL